MILDFKDIVSGLMMKKEHSSLTTKEDKILDKLMDWVFVEEVEGSVSSYEDLFEEE